MRIDPCDTQRKSVTSTSGRRTTDGEETPPAAQTTCAHTGPRDECGGADSQLHCGWQRQLLRRDSAPSRRPRRLNRELMWARKDIAERRRRRRQCSWRASSASTRTRRSALDSNSAATRGSSMTAPPRRVRSIRDFLVRNETVRVELRKQEEIRHARRQPEKPPRSE